MDWKEFSSHLGHLSHRDSRRIEKAFVLAKKAHDGQYRKSGEPYFIHPAIVAEMLAHLGADADTIIAALLHDTIEDTPLTLEEIDRQFGPAVTTLINGVTKLDSSHLRQGPKLNEQVETLRKIFTLMQEDVRIIVIKLVDRLHNMQTIRFLAPARQQLFAEETKEVFVKIAEKLGMLDIRDELAMLCLETLEPELSERIQHLQTNNRLRGADIVEKMRSALGEKFGFDTTALPELVYEDKNLELLKSQLRMEGSTATGYPSLIVAIVCEDITSCYRTLGDLHQIWPREILSFQDFINTPGANGYRGVHTTVILEDGTRVRCKIRTKEMHVYARQGMMTQCFHGSRNITEILQWAQRISPLARDTEESSEDFWQSLQSDILGDTLTVYGPGGMSAQIPKQSTALDAAFYFMREEALKVTGLKIDGVAISFDTSLHQAVSLDLTLAEEQTMDRNWLSIVKTGFATAIIRSALAAHPVSNKVAVGQAALQHVLSSKKKGSLEELRPESLSPILQEQGFGSLEEAYVAIAEGRRKAEDVYSTLFEKRTQKPELTSRTKYRFGFIIAPTSIPALQRCMNIGNQCDIDWTSIRVKNRRDALLHVSGNVAATGRELDILRQDLRWAGASQLEFAVPKQAEFLMTAIVILLWGLHPVLARWLLSRGIPPMMLASFRLITFGVWSILLFVGWHFFSKKRFTFLPIPRLFRLAVLPSLISVALSIFTYYALESVPPSLHLTILRLNVLLLPIIQFLHSRRSSTISGITLLMAAIGIVILMLTHPATLSWGILLSTLSLCAYALYSFLVENALHTHKIGFRYPALLCSSGILQGISGIALLSFGYWHTLSLHNLTLLILVMTVCVFIPHTFYYMLLNKRQTKQVADLFFLEPPIAIIGEIILLNLLLPSWTYGFIAVALIGMYFVKKRQNGNASA
jgi:RelA/SpoT family (p)ppGpp synthetase